MKQIAQNYKTGELVLLDVPVPASRPGGVLVRTEFSVVSLGTERAKVSESKLSLIGKARARPDQVKKVLKSVRQQGLLSTYQKVMNRLDSYTPLGYSLAGEVVDVGEGVDEFRVGQKVACAGNQYAFHAEYNWVPTNMCALIPAGVDPAQAAFTTIATIPLHAMRQSEIRLGEIACVVGLGLIGQILVRLLCRAGVRVVGIDPVSERCRMAEAAGAVVCVDPDTAGSEGFKDQVRQLSAGHGVDCVFIAAAGKDNGPIELAAELLRDRGRVVDIGKCSLDLPWNAYYDKELDVRFSRSYGPGRYDHVYEESGIDYPIGYVRWTERRNMECILSMLADGPFELASLISDAIPFDSAVETYERLNRGDVPGLGLLFRYVDAAPVARRLQARRPTPFADKVRIGVIGAGNYASSMLLPHLKNNLDAVLVEVATNSPLSAVNAAGKFGFMRSSTDSEGLLNSTDVDAIVIATRHSSHARLTCAALRAGKAVFVEKPLAIDRESIQEILATIAETGNERLMVGFNRRFSPFLAELKLAWGQRRSRHVLRYRVNADEVAQGSWYKDTVGEGTRFVGEGGHFIDTVSWWLGEEPVEVFAAATTDDPDNIVATLNYLDGSVAVIDYLTSGNPQLPKERLEIFGEKRAAVFENFTRFDLYDQNRVISRRSRSIDKGQKVEMNAFVSAVKAGKPMPIPLSSLVSTTFASLAAQESCAANRPIRLDGHEVPKLPAEAPASG